MKGETNGTRKDRMKGKEMDKGHHGMHGMKGMEEQKEYAYVREVETGFDETIARVKDELKKEGFGGPQ